MGAENDDVGSLDYNTTSPTNSVSNTYVQEYEIDDAEKDDHVIEFPQKIKKLKLKFKRKERDVDQRAAAEVDDDNIIAPSALKKIEKIKMHKRIVLGDCVNIKYLSKYWRGIFPPRTKWLSFNNRKKGCNFDLLRYILRTHSKTKYDTVTNVDIKELLIKYYNKYVMDNGGNTVKLYRLWRKENKGHYRLGDNSGVDEIINKDDYNITKTDLILLAYHLSLPIVVYYESKDKLRLTHFANNDTDNIYYFVKQTSRMDDLYLTSRKMSIRFERADLGEQLLTALNENAITDFLTYLDNA